MFVPAIRLRKLKILFSSIELKTGFSLLSSPLLIIILLTGSIVSAQTVPCVCASCGYACGKGHAKDCPYNSSSSSGGSSSGGSNWIQNLRDARQAQKLTNAYQFNEKGNEEYQKKNWEAAVKYYKKAYRNNPDDEQIGKNLALAEDAFNKQKDSEKYKKEKEKKEAEDAANWRKLQDEAKKRELEKQEALAKANKEMIDNKLKEAQQKVISLQKDILRAQNALKVYSKSLQNNTAEFEKWGATVDEAYNSVIDNSKGYLANMFLKYNLLGGLKREEQKIVFNKLRDILGSSNPELQKWLAIISKSNAVNLDEVEDIIDRVNASGDLADLISSDNKGTVKHNLDALLLVNSLIETFNLAGYKDFIQNVSKPFGFGNMPGDYFEQAKMIGQTYADLSSICYSWFMINKLTKDDEVFSEKINLLSFNMQYQMKQMNCLNKCIDNYTTGCIEKCTGKTRLSTPPPLLKYN